MAPRFREFIISKWSTIQFFKHDQHASHGRRMSTIEHMFALDDDVPDMLGHIFYHRDGHRLPAAIIFGADTEQVIYFYDKNGNTLSRSDAEPTS